jgi:hypothetical protein
MKKLHLLFFIILSTSLIIKASPPRKKTDVGFFAGTSFYMGEINQDHLFYRPAPSFGGMIRWKLNDTYALRAQALYGQFSAYDRDFNNQYQIKRNASFNSSLIDINAIIEYNFFPLKFDERKTVFSPYLFTGIGYDIILNSSGNIGNHFNIPFGAGLKLHLQRKIVIGCEWGLRKLLYDKADGIINPDGNNYKSLFSNKDWYSFTGIFITFGLFGNQGTCPVYQ